MRVAEWHRSLAVRRSEIGVRPGKSLAGGAGLTPGKIPMYSLVFV